MHQLLHHMSLYQHSRTSCNAKNYIKIEEKITLCLTHYDFSGSLKQQQCDPLDFKCTSYCTICHCTNFSNIMQCKQTASKVKKEVIVMIVMAMMVMTIVAMVFVIYNFSSS